MKKRNKLLGVSIVVILLAVTFAFGLVSIFIDFGYIANEDETKQAATAYCQETFDQQWDYKGYHPGDPPTMICVNGDQTGYVEMPKTIATRYNITSASYQD
jgi:hypothetical protein